MTDLDKPRRQLREIPDLYAQVGGYLIPGSAPVDPEARRPASTKSRPPISVDIVDLVAAPKDGWQGWQPGDDLDFSDPEDPKMVHTGYRNGIAGTLWLWGRLLEAEMADAGYRFTPCGSDVITTVTGWLVMHLEWIVDLHGRDFTDDVGRMHRALRRACGIRPEPVYHCPSCGWRIEPRDRMAWWVCTGCRSTWTSAAEIDRLLARQEDSMTLRECAAAVSRPLSTLKEWKSRGWITPVGRRRGVDIYSATIVQRIADTVQQGVRRA